MERMAAAEPPVTNVTVQIGGKDVAAVVKKEIIKHEKNSSPNH